ncbi:MAG TPA: hypothetical protein DHW71_13500 [Gammaproteobacteria bacterium]|nr:hypothetical protein [Gammaproteobacteria bacterium]MEC8010891.1 lipoprotein [Pseudomonadota bacterium]HBF06788.1 hypothetical protein [Gammaproteobacteria bacterium]HCK94004.1 hypothetical protein [Gammaproteobacteria bacterium]|tara:strand:- start:720 stop:983 length:264 start_codon:yes stop_codon:yes gene_type:complete
MTISRVLFKACALSTLLLTSLTLTACGNKADLYMPGESPQEMAIKKKKEQIKSNDVVSPSADSEEVKTKYYENEANPVPVISHPKSD